MTLLRGKTVPLRRRDIVEPGAVAALLIDLCQPVLTLGIAVGGEFSILLERHGLDRPIGHGPTVGGGTLFGGIVRLGPSDARQGKGQNRSKREGSDHRYKPHFSKCARKRTSEPR